MRALRLVPVLAACGLLSLCAADWPSWRGPGANGQSPEKLDPAAVAAGKVAWKKNVGLGYAAVAVKDGKVYATGFADGKDTLVCLSVDGGAEAWSFSHPAKRDLGYGGFAGPRATPVVAGGLVYIVSLEGLVQAVDASGKRVWAVDLAKDLKMAAPSWGFCGSALVDGTALYLNAGAHGVALEAATGKTLWASPAGKGGYATPVLYRDGAKAVLAVFGEKALCGVDPATGAQLWSHPWPTKYDVNAADPLVEGGKAFISSGYGTGCALLELGKEPRLAWQHKALACHFSSPVLVAGNLYAVDGNTGSKAHLKCLDFATGTQKWAQPVGFASLIAVDGKLLALDENGSLFVAEASGAGYKELARLTVLAGAKDAKCWTAPVLAGGHVYCRGSTGDLVCLDVSGK